MFNPHLLELWQGINARGFGGQLHQPAGLGFVDASTLSQIESHDDLAVTTPSGLIVLNELLRWDPAAVADKTAVNHDRELGRYRAARFVLIHEMVHQSLHQNRVRHDHDEPFVNEANRIKPNLDELAELPDATADNAHFWPYPVSVLQEEYGF